jgi:hypothetical protein
MFESALRGALIIWHKDPKKNFLFNMKELGKRKGVNHLVFKDYKGRISNHPSCSNQQHNPSMGRLRVSTCEEACMHGTLHCGGG